MTKRFLIADYDVLDYQGIVEPTSESQMLGYKAVAWNTGLQWTGWWQGRNVMGMSTADPLFSHGQGGNVNDVSQAIQIQYTWKAGEKMEWLWEAEQGQSDYFGMKALVAQPISYGTNHQASNFLLRYEDISSFNPDWGHGQRLWIQAFTFDNKYPHRPMEIYLDPYTDGRDIVVNVPIRQGTYGQYFDFSGSAEIQQFAHDDLRVYSMGQNRQQFTDLTYLAEAITGIDLQNESGYWSVIQAGFTSEMASFQPTDWRSAAWGIGDHGAQQTAVMNIEVWDA